MKQAGTTKLTRDQHPVSRKMLSPNAVKVMYRLNKAGFKAYLVGGGVRDILLGLKPKDFDIATDATPEQVKSVFRNCRLIGRRFRLAHILFGKEIIEVATFRGHHDANEKAHHDKISKKSNEGMLLRDNIYGSIEEDAQRRDFTVNALYYGVDDYCVYDYANGLQDIANRQIRLIGDPETRYREDPVRMIRAIRFATKLDMTIHPDTQAPIAELSSLMGNIPPARMFEEYTKMFLSGKALANFEMLRQYGLFRYFFPAADRMLNDDNPQLLAFIRQALSNTDQRIANEQRVTPAFLLAVMLWVPLQHHYQRFMEKKGAVAQDAMYAAMGQVIDEQQAAIAIPRRFQTVMRDIWMLQERLTRREGKKAFRLVTHPKFRAGYDFLLLRADTAEVDKETLSALAKWWTDFQQVPAQTQNHMVKAVNSGRTTKKRSYRRRKKPSTGN
ncbi:polynucleotide adenylyltransferase PcnB [Thalassotalea agarivorans]|uniref:Poly(A) polymerase I n=1 Tax=Thalassotalea agarivorans TaxID=349064 RepID=A0A1I0GMI3_THASX|nr:polynucleotide adenylyltransferase PcnB [Thalassotalea agarivorans]SET72183.1 poly(A) polymerase [Thalassotalea agarivorans]